MLRTWAFASVGLLAFAVLVWFAGPLLVIGGQAPLASPTSRLLVVGIFAAQYLAQKLWNLWRARRNNERVVAALEPPPEPGLTPEGMQLRERFTTALAQLRRAKLGSRGWSFGRSYVYQLPWYVIIGAPGTGKTTALLNSGLEFPLAGKLGRGPVGGFGGTRNCDWWFTDRAVLIDTAGRYTTHETDRSVDRHAWELFLQLLLRSRPRRPLNGVLVAVSVSDLLEFTPAQLADHARILKARLEELRRALRVRLPVYVMLTKCDLLPGFMDWFGLFDRKERDQVWGVTFPAPSIDPGGGQAPGTEGTAVAELGASFDRLVDRLTDGLLGRLQAERDLQRRARIFSLPSQLRALSEPLGALISGIFGADEGSAGPAGGGAGGPASTLLRGVYLTSGTQHGTPIDRMLFALGRELGLERQILPPNRGSGQSFFLAGLLNEVVLAEAELGGHTPPRKRWHRRVLVGSMTSLLLLATLVAAWWLVGYSRSVRQMAVLDGDITRARSVVTAIPASEDPDPRPLLPALDALHSLDRTFKRGPGKTELFDIGGKSRRKLAAAAGDAYERMLLGPFQRRIAKAIDSTMRAGADVNVQYEALKAYQMLNDAAHFDAGGLKIFVMSYWSSVLTPPLSLGERAELTNHLDALLAAGAVGSGLGLEPALVDSVRARLSSQSGAQRIALRLAVAQDLHPHADFAIDSLGEKVAGLFVGADGKSPPKPVPGRYTLDAYREVVIGRIPALASQLASESKWVLGVPGAGAEVDAALAMASYRAAYAQAWNELVDDVHLKPATSNQDAAWQAQTLGEPDGPLPLLLDAIVHQTPAHLEDGSAGPIVPTDAAGERLVALADLIARDTNGASPLDATMHSFRELHALRTPRASSAVPGDNTAGSGDRLASERLARVMADAKREPEPVRSMLLTLAVLPADSGVAQGSRVSGAALSRLIASRLGVPCIDLVAGHFPFDRRAMSDASLEEFAHVFAPKGAFDQVFGQLLASRVDTSSDTWQPRGPGAGPTPEDLERFRAAARIREVFFAHGEMQPSFQLTFRPLDLDEEIDRFQLDIDGQTVRYAHGPPVPTTVRWPGPQTRGNARIELTPASAGPPVQYNGPWALFRLFDHAAIKEGGSPGHFEVVFDVGGHHASFEVETDSGANPFRLRELERFDCPIAGS